MPRRPPAEPASEPQLADLPLSTLRGIGPKLAEKLARLHLHSVQDLLFHLPLRYQDRSRIAPLGALRHGDECLVEGEVQHAEVVIRKRRALLVRIADGSGQLTLRFFYFSRALREQCVAGARLRCFGEARSGPTGMEMVHPECQPTEAGAAPPEDRLTPVYPVTEGLQQPSLRRLSEQALALLAEGAGPRDWLPTGLPGSAGLPDLRTALLTVHRPPRDADAGALRSGSHPAVQRLAFEELLAHRLGLLRLRSRAQAQPAPQLAGDGELFTRLLAALPFAPTAAQRRVIAEIDADLRRQRPMLRLLQGDVGCGKTLVAAAAAAQAVEAGWQVALMAPTELLAEQHWRNFSAWFEPLGVGVRWLSGRLPARRRAALLEEIESAAAQIVVGTHALFQADVSFARLGLAMVDEQHRFGVHQRLALTARGGDAALRPHQLTMTATPIPRTLAMTAYADLDLSLIDELPPGRQPVTTVALAAERRVEVIERIAAALAEQRRVYWVCTLVEDSESLDAQAATETAAELAEAIPAARVGLIHGRLKAAEKDSVMAAFAAGELDLLVATTVIEVGVDVPAASLMIIENAERLGLAQLHQLRGRVGRGSASSACVLLYRKPLSQNARERLRTLRESNDGFAIAQKDLQIRGAGELLGTRQTGLVSFRIADLSRDAGLLNAVQTAADALLGAHPEAVEPLIARWLGEESEDYSRA